MATQPRDVGSDVPPPREKRVVIGGRVTYVQVDDELDPDRPWTVNANHPDNTRSAP